MLYIFVVKRGGNCLIQTLNITLYHSLLNFQSKFPYANTNEKETTTSMEQPLFFHDDVEANNKVGKTVIFLLF